MKKIISYTLSLAVFLSYLFSLVLIISCAQPAPKAENAAARGGKSLSGKNKGEDYRFGRDQEAKLALAFSTAFVNKDYAFLSQEHFSDTLFFYPEKGLDRLTFDIPTAIELLQAMHAPYDSIRRSVYDVIPVVPSYDESLTIVMFPFTETRYKKDGTIETFRFFERHYIREGKINGVRKWSQEEIP